MPATPALTPAPSRPRGEARRSALLDATLRIVAEAGADAVTHRRVAEVADLPLASTTYWFASKEHLLTAALERAAELDLAQLAAAVRALGDGPVTAGQLVAVLVPAGAERPHRGTLLAVYTLLLEAARRPGLQALARRWTEAYTATVGELLGRAGSPRPAADARLLLAAADGLVVDALATGAPADDDDDRAELTHLVDALLAAHRVRA